MKLSDKKLPPTVQARIQVLETILLLLRGSLNHARGTALAAHADEIEDVTAKIESLRSQGGTSPDGRRVLTDKPEAALTGAR